MESNAELIKKYLSPLIPKGDIIASNIWRKEFTNSINILLKNPKIIKTGKEELNKKSEIDLNSKNLSNINFNETVDKYQNLINQWTPEISIDVFWLKGVKLSQVDSKEILKHMYIKYDKELIQEIYNLKKEVQNENENILIKLATHKYLNQDDFEKLEIKNLDFCVKKSANFPLFRKLVKIGDNYESSLIWEYYLEFHKGNQLFLNKVKESFQKENRKYEFDEIKLDFFSKNKYTRTLKINPNMLIGSNPKLQTKNLDNFVVGLNNWLHELGKTIEEDVEMTVNYEKTGHRVIGLNFDKKESINEFDMIIEKFSEHFKEIIGSVIIEKDKPPSMYKDELMILGNYYNLNSKFKEKPKEKLKKI